MVTSRVTWRPSYRLIAARLPRLDIFETIADPADLPAVLELEALTNPRLSPTIGPLQAIPVEDRIVGPGAAFVMAAFAYPTVGRFTDGRYGAYYAAGDLETAIAEVSYHRARFAAATPTPPMDFDERVIEAEIDAELVDLRGESRESPIYDPNPEHYAHGQACAAEARAAAAQGIVYTSVRRAGGECVAIFVPRLVRNARTTGYVGLRWDGKRITDTYRKESLTTTYPLDDDR
ncbi:MAG TPA: RES family NAD+ phosphorylase [Candidatus Limnocylindria bacterium]|nr:RES family NAD+ phosphorylase [Candidatus Limnocylindria bacterium]